MPFKRANNISKKILIFTIHNIIFNYINFFSKISRWGGKAGIEVNWFVIRYIRYPRLYYRRPRNHIGRDPKSRYFYYYFFFFVFFFIFSSRASSSSFFGSSSLARRVSLLAKEYFSTETSRVTRGPRARSCARVCPSRYSDNTPHRARALQA